MRNISVDSVSNTLTMCQWKYHTQSCLHACSNLQNLGLPCISTCTLGLASMPVPCNAERCAYIVVLQGFAERKILLVCDVIGACKKIHADALRKERLAALKSRSVGLYKTGWQ